MRILGALMMFFVTLSLMAHVAHALHPAPESDYTKIGVAIIILPICAAIWAWTRWK